MLRWVQEVATDAVEAVEVSGPSHAQWRYVSNMKAGYGGGASWGPPQGGQYPPRGGYGQGGYGGQDAGQGGQQGQW